MPSFDAIRMRHMREAAAAALEIAAAYKRPELSRNQVVAMALTRCLEILGEAASKMTPEARLRFPAIPFVKWSRCGTVSFTRISMWISMLSGPLSPKIYPLSCPPSMRRLPR